MRLILVAIFCAEFVICSNEQERVVDFFYHPALNVCYVKEKKESVIHHAIFYYGQSPGNLTKTKNSSRINTQEWKTLHSCELSVKV